MTFHSSVQVGSLASQVSAGTPLNANLSRGKIRVKYAKIAASAQTLAQDEYAKLFKLPKGANVILVAGKHGAFGASVTLDIGIGTTSAGVSATEDTFLAAQTISAAGSFIAVAATPGALADDTWVVAHFEGANPADDKDLEIWMFYAVE